MTVYVGGLRARLIHDSFYTMVSDALAALGWFDPAREHRPINLIPEMQPEGEPIEVNTIVISGLDENDTDAEMGSNLSENRLTYYVDIYAEGEALGSHLKGDVKDILRGKMPSIGRGRPVLEVRDLTVPAAPLLFVCDIENVVTDRSATFSNPWQRYWWVLRCELVDTYGDEDDV